MIDIEYRRAQKRKWAKTAARGFEEFKKTLACVDCGIQDFRVLQFHHRGNAHKLNSGKKVNISVWVQTGRDWRRYAQECDVLCANCHIIRHYGERNGNE